MSSTTADSTRPGGYLPRSGMVSGQRVWQRPEGQRYAEDNDGENGPAFWPVLRQGPLQDVHPGLGGPPAQGQRTQHPTARVRRAQPKALGKGSNVDGVLADKGREVTTLTVRNIPARYSQAQLIKEWPPGGSYNFIQLPCCPVSNRSLGFAFINFISAEAAGIFYATWHGQRLASHGTNRRLSVSIATVQGFEANLKHVMQSLGGKPIDVDRLPAIFQDGREVDFMSLMVVHL